MALLVAATGQAGCAAGRSTAVGPGGHRVEVVAGVFPLAELARRIGLNRVRVTDLSEPGPSGEGEAGRGAADDPGALHAGPETVKAIDRGAVVLLVGRGFQPGIEQAAGGRPSVVTVGPVDDDPDLRAWLDPVAMQQLATRVADGLSRADPAGRSDYQAAAKVYNAQLGALDIDYRTSLADCARRDLVTADGAFHRIAHRYGLIGHTAADGDIVHVLAANGVTTIFTEPLAPAAPVLALARQFHLKTQELATLERRDAAEVHRAATYISMMADNLAQLRAAQACTSPPS